TAYRALRMLDDARRVGLYGSATATRLAADLARLRGREALLPQEEHTPPASGLDAALVFSPAKDMVRHALEAVADGGRAAGVSDVPGYRASIAAPQLAEERRVHWVAGATRSDLQDLLALVRTSPLEPAAEVFPMAVAGEALARLRTGRAAGSVVLSSP